ncbi:MAG: cell division protein FtsI (penicillin-binding protein 3) [Parcubacteria group bacterium Athens1014_10]|nr:MAG: cell division protein FtsI (penicillin-binding protein 3) [Parcubacteria group bacterium Athens1014_10]TSD05982.1 MAG: cell division protein FtsI (penicillin-binding protein 3) [Parcubacteria group bacterium Athens0714_12]
MIFNKKKLKNKKISDCFTLPIVVIFIFYSLIIIRLFNLQIVKHNFYIALASGSQQFSEELYPTRGKIFIKDKKEKLYPIAANLELYLVFAVPVHIKEPEKTAETIAPILELSKEDILPKLSKENDFYEILKHYVAKEKVEEIKTLKIKGVEFIPETKRFYPEKNLFSQLTGFIGYQGDGKAGQYGLEEYYEKILSGQKGSLEAKRSALGSLIFLSDYNLEKAKNGADLILTLERTIQYKTCEELKNTVQEHGADGGTVIIMEPKTGKILALCNYPDFDPNNYGQIKDLNLFANPAISYTYEPGSIFKAITMAAALEEKKVTPQTTYQDEGFVKIDGHTIENSDKKEHGAVNMIKVLEESLNTGAIFAVRQVGVKIFKDYVEKFGFGKITDIELPVEGKGDINSLSQKEEIYSATASFGQGISVTPLQVVSAFSAIANKGKLMKPYLVEKIIYSNEEISEIKPKLIREVISSNTASTLGAMLVSVVENGHGKNAGVKGYYVAGKTGTAQVPKKDGRGYEEGVNIGSFAGFAPVDDPKFAMLVKIDNPKDVAWAESSAAPLFGKLAEFMLNYYQIPPEK